MEVPCKGNYRVLSGSAPIDPNELRSEKARTAAIIAEISGDRLSYDQAYAELEGFAARGTLTVTFKIDDEGLVVERWDDSRIVNKERGKVEETMTSQTVTKRTLVTDVSQFEIADNDWEPDARQ